ncbi:protein kinase [Acetobacterium sp.]|uniref:protein kinase domain-containing protein n=1 Tax=Acetobacterium sp. TaxID=1872094 RepID=UPI0035939EB3
MERKALINIEQRIYEVFSRRYIVIGLLGCGGMGAVFYAKSNDNLSIERAIKVLDKQGYNVNLDIFAEAYALKNLNHPCIPKVIEVLEKDDFVYIVQEYVQGDSLKTIVKNNGKIDEKILLAWMGQVAETVKYLHEQGIIHRDIKPDNIMVNPEGQIKLIDFGLARSRSEVDEVDEKVIGTLSYTAPERFSKASATVQTDIYGFGTTMYMVATGLKPESTRKHPRSGFGIMKNNLKKNCSPGVVAILSKSIAIDPNQRYFHFDQILYDIAKVEPFNQFLQKQRSRETIKMSLLTLGFVCFMAMIPLGFYNLKLEKEQQYNTIISSGTELLDQGKVKESIDEFQKGVDLMPEGLTAQQGIMEVYTRQGDFDEVINYGIELYQKDEEAKKNAEIAYLIGNAYFESNKFEQALPYLQDGVALSPAVEHNLVLGMDYCGLKQFDQAEEVVSVFQQEVENSDAADYLLAQIAERQGDNIKARASYEKVISETKKTDLKRKACLSLARLYKGEKNYAAIVTLLETYQTETAGKMDVGINEYLGEAYYGIAKNGQAECYEKAKKAFQSLLDVGYTRPYLFRNIAIIEQETGNFDAAFAVLNKMETEYPDDYTVPLQEAWLFIEMENQKPNESRNYSDAKSAYEETMEKAGNSSSDQEVQMLTAKINEIKTKGW